MPSLSDALSEIRAVLNACDPDRMSVPQASFAQRLKALDRLEVEGLDRLELLGHGDPTVGETNADITTAIADIRSQVDSAMVRLEDANTSLFESLRGEIREGLQGPALRTRLSDLLAPPVRSGQSDSNRRSGFGYDDLDALLNGIFSAEPIPSETKQAETEMVYYQKTPGKVILEMADAIRTSGLRGGEVFYDLGSGLGQVPLLVHLLTGIDARGVEFEPAYVGYSGRCARSLGLTGVSFVEADVREADLSDGSVFFLYTPFTGSMLENVMEKLRRVSEQRRIRIFTYGPCTRTISRLAWLEAVGLDPVHEDRLTEFSSGR